MSNNLSNNTPSSSKGNRDSRGSNRLAQLSPEQWDSLETLLDDERWKLYLDYLSPRYEHEWATLRNRRSTSEDAAYANGSLDTLDHTYLLTPKAAREHRKAEVQRLAEEKRERARDADAQAAQDEYDAQRAVSQQVSPM